MSNSENTKKPSFFENENFQEKFQNALTEYNTAIDNDENPPQAAKEFIDSLFDGDLDSVFEYQLVLENIKDENTARRLQDIVFNSAADAIS